MTTKHIRYEVGTYRPWTKEKGWGPFESLEDVYEVGTYRPWTKEKGWGPFESPEDVTWQYKKYDYGEERISYCLHPDGCTLPKPYPEYFTPPAWDPVDKMQIDCLPWSWGHDLDDLEPHPENQVERNHYFHEYWIKQTLRVDRTNSEIKFNLHGPRKNLVLGFSSTCSLNSTKDRGVKSLSIFLFEEPDPKCRFAKLTLIRFPGHFIEDEAEQRNFIGHFLKHWWRLKPDTGSPFIFHNQKDGQWINLTFDTMPDDIR